MTSPVPTKTLAWGSVLAVLLPACAPRLEWEMPVQIMAGGRVVSGVEVAVGGRFVGLSDVHGRLLVPLEGAPGTRIRVEARDPAVERLLRPASTELVLPTFWTWLSGAGLSGRSTLDAMPLRLEPLPEATDNETRASEGSVDAAIPDPVEHHGLPSGGVESDLPDPAEGVGGAVGGGVGEAASTAASPSPADPARDTAGSNGRAGPQQSNKAAGAGDPGGAAGAGAVAPVGKEAGPVARVASGADPGTEASGGPDGRRAVAGDPKETADGRAAGATGATGTSGDEGGHSRSHPSEAGSRPVPRVAPPLGPLSLAVEIYSEGKPVVGAEAYSVRRASGRIVRLGESDVRGVLESDHPGALLGETLLVRHPCCVSLQRPLPAPLPPPAPPAGTRVGNAPSPAPPRRVRVDLAPGVSHDFVAVETAYGVPRVVEKVSISQGGRTLDLTGPTGVALIGRKNLSPGLVALEVSAPDALPARRAVAFEIAATSEARPFVVSLARSTPRPPNVGMLERVKGEVVHAESHLQGEPLYRRARRDFLSRFVREKTIRPLIFQEVRRLASAAAIDPTRLTRRGWEMGPLAGEIDFLAVLESADGPGGLSIRLVDATGNVAWRGVFPYDGEGAPPEAAGRGAFEGLVAALPMEYAVAATDPVRLSTGQGEAGTVAAGDAFTRVSTTASRTDGPGFGNDAGGAGPSARPPSHASDTCEGRVGRDGATLLLDGECQPAVAVGDIFARRGKAGVAEKEASAKGR